LYHDLRHSVRRGVDYCDYHASVQQIAWADTGTVAATSGRLQATAQCGWMGRDRELGTTIIAGDVRRAAEEGLVCTLAVRPTAGQSRF